MSIFTYTLKKAIKWFSPLYRLGFIWLAPTTIMTLFLVTSFIANSCKYRHHTFDVKDIAITTGNLTADTSITNGNLTVKYFVWLLPDKDATNYDPPVKGSVMGCQVNQDINVKTAANMDRKQRKTYCQNIRHLASNEEFYNQFRSHIRVPYIDYRDLKLEEKTHQAYADLAPVLEHIISHTSMIIVWVRKDRFLGDETEPVLLALQELQRAANSLKQNLLDDNWQIRTDMSIIQRKMDTIHQAGEKVNKLLDEHLSERVFSLAKHHTIVGKWLASWFWDYDINDKLKSFLRRSVLAFKNADNDLNQTIKQITVINCDTESISEPEKASLRTITQNNNLEFRNCEN